MLALWVWDTDIHSHRCTQSLLKNRNAIREADKGDHYERLFASIDSCGRILSELAKAAPERVSKRLVHGYSRYEITRKREG